MEKLKGAFFVGIALFAAGTCANFATEANSYCQPTDDAVDDDTAAINCQGNGAAAVFAFLAAGFNTVAAISYQTKEYYQPFFLIGLGCIAASFGSEFASTANVDCDPKNTDDDVLCSSGSVASTLMFIAFSLSLLAGWFLHIDMANKAYGVFLLSLASIAGGYIAYFGGNANSLELEIEDTTGDLKTYLEKLQAGAEYATYGNALAFILTIILAVVLLISGDDAEGDDEMSKTGTTRFLGWMVYLFPTAAGFGGLAFAFSDASCFLNDKIPGGSDVAEIQCDNYLYASAFDGLCVIAALIGCCLCATGGVQMRSFFISFTLGWFFLSQAMVYQIEAQSACEAGDLDDDQLENSCLGYSVAASVTFLGGAINLVAGVLCFFEDSLSW